MRMLALPLIILSTILVPLLHATPAQALNNKSWVSSTGSGSTCTRLAPCGGFQTALSQTNPGGEIGVVDSGDYGTLVIDRAISIVAEGVDATIVSAGAGSAAITFSGSMIPTDVVSLEGLIIDGLGAGGIGISWPFGPALVVKNCVIRNFKSASSGYGIYAQINTTGRLTVLNTHIVNNNGGILIGPTGSGTVHALFDRVTLANSLFGIKADSSGMVSGQINVEVIDSVAAHHANNGFIASSGAGQAQIRYKITRSSAFDNGAFGAVATGAQAFMIVGGSSLTDNGTGLAQLSGSTVATYGNNDVNFNTTNTSGTITAITQK